MDNIPKIIFALVIFITACAVSLLKIPSVFAYKADILHYLGEGHGGGSPETDPLNELTQSQYGGYTREVVESLDSNGAASKFVADGKLQYPDGSPRYRVIIFGGGSGQAYYYGRDCASYKYCGPGLKRTGTDGKTGRQKIIDFIDSGGGYVGMCAGSYFASKCYNDSGGTTCKGNEGVYSGIWPGITQGHSATGVRYDHLLTNHEINTGFNGKIPSVWFYGGSSLTLGAPNTSYAAQFSVPAGNNYHDSMDGKTAIIVYDTGTSSTKGRVVVSGSHPEIDNHDYWRRMVTYAMGKIPPVHIINSIANGATLSSSSYYLIGDNQFHYYSVDLPDGANYSLKVDLQDGPVSGDDNNLYIKKGDLPTTGNYDYRSITSTPNETVTVSNASSGRWFIGIHGVHSKYTGADYSVKAFYAVTGISSPTSTSTDCPLKSSGDFNCDGKINESDLNSLLGKWMTNVNDLTGDGKVNESDLNKLLGNWKIY